MWNRYLVCLETLAGSVNILQAMTGSSVHFPRKLRESQQRPHACPSVHRRISWIWNFVFRHIYAILWLIPD